jgi:hypothetical protein
MHQLCAWDGSVSIKLELEEQKGRTVHAQSWFHSPFLSLSR